MRALLFLAPSSSPPRAPLSKERPADISGRLRPLPFGTFSETHRLPSQPASAFAVP